MTIPTDLTPLKSALSNFNTVFKSVYSSIAQLKAEGIKLVSALSNQTEQLRIVHRVQIHEHISSRLPNLKDKLTGKILLGIESEINELCRIRNETESLVYSLKQALDEIDGSAQNIDCDSAEVEAFNLLHCYALSDEVYRCLASFALEVQIAIAMANYLEEDSIQRLQRVFNSRCLNKPSIEGYPTFSARLLITG